MGDESFTKESVFDFKNLGEEARENKVGSYKVPLKKNEKGEEIEGKFENSEEIKERVFIEEKKNELKKKQKGK